MKLPKTFLPEKNLEKNVERLLDYVPPNAGSFAYKYMYGDKISLLEVESGLSEPVFRFDESLLRLRLYGYERHIRPWEYFDLVISHLENSLEEKPDCAVKNILQKNSTCWLSMAIEKKDNTLFCYVDPENLQWDEDKMRYVIDGKLNYTTVSQFYIADMPTGKWVRSKELGEWFTHLVYHRRFEDLPKEMKQEHDGTYVYMPLDNSVWPVCVGRYNFRYSIDFSPIHTAASLGIRNKRN